VAADKVHSLDLICACDCYLFLELGDAFLGFSFAAAVQIEEIQL
jgi:hypothetical protein